ncbi:MAG: hypothetical protein IJ317_00525 [Clostridia bacterium]|nr:hypothetical protein [Clostridia bacterium]
MKRYVLRFFAVALAGAATFGIACEKNGGGSSVPVAVERPVGLMLSGRELVWEEVDGASGYVVEINGKEYSTQDNVYAFSDGAYGRISARVKAQNGDKESEYSPFAQDTLRWKLPTPTGLELENETLVWDEVALAEGYIVSVDGVQYYAEESGFALDVTDENVVKVLARGNVEGTLISSEFSAPLKFPVLLSTPKNFRFDGETTLVWDEVALATGYTVFLNGAEYTRVTGNRFEIPAEISGADISELQIRADSETDVPSELSERVSVGKVSERNPKAIATAADLMQVGETGYYKLTANIDLMSASPYWQIEKFKGSFDGNGFKITGLTNSLFGALDGAKVKRLTLENSLISRTLTEHGESVGALAATVTDSELIDCKVSANVTVDSQNGVGYVGGIVGVSQGTDMSNVTFEGSITSSYCVTGGLIGKAYEPNTQSEITRCGVSAKIALTGGERTYCGGFIGLFTDNTLTVSECKAAVEIETNAAYSGGFIGYMGTGKTVDCYVTGSIENTNTQLAHVGGFIGRMEGYNVEVTRCISMATVQAGEGAQIKVGGFVGVTVGGSYANVYANCYYDNTLAPIDRIGNVSVGKGDGIAAKTTDALQSLDYTNGYLETVWTLGGGTPALKWETV